MKEEYKKELEELREDDYCYHQLIRMQNKREYRSKFLKEFQQEYGTNTFPDYDEIYKRYDKLKKEIDKLTAESTEWESKCYDLQEENKILKQTVIKINEEYNKLFNHYFYDILQGEDNK